MAGTTVAPFVLPPPLSSLAWDMAQDEFGVMGTDFLGQMSRVLLSAAQDQRVRKCVSRWDMRLILPRAAQDQIPYQVVDSGGLRADFPGMPRKTRSGL